MNEVDHTEQAHADHSNSATPLIVILSLVAVVALVYGFFQISEATWGVGVIAAGILVAVLARIVQAGSHHKALIEELRHR